MGSTKLGWQAWHVHRHAVFKMQRKPVLSTDKMSHDKQNHNCLDHSQNLVMSPGRDSTPRLTD